VGTYHDYLPAFRELMKQERTFVRFYGAAQKLALLDFAQRQQQLEHLTGLATLDAERLSHPPQQAAVAEAAR
jgi:predicted aminopeptidase